MCLPWDRASAVLAASSGGSNSYWQMLHRVSRDANVGRRVELWEVWHPWFRRNSRFDLALRAIARSLGMAKNTTKTYASAKGPPIKKLSAKAEALATSLIAAD